MSAEPRLAPGTPPRASIVIPVRNAMNLTRSCLGALRTQALRDDELIVVDDGSDPRQAAGSGLTARGMRTAFLRGRRRCTSTR